MDALIFDFDGVVVDSEPIHLMGFRRALAAEGVTISEDDYYGKYLGFDDHDCFQAVGRDTGKAFSEARIAEMTVAKSDIVRETFAHSIEALPGAVALILAAAAAGIPLAICSGALRDEIELAARTVGVLESFAVVVAAKDVQNGKPDPEGYALAAQRLEEASGRTISFEKCVVVEDSPAGIAAAKSAGMKVLAVTNSYPADALGQADRIVDSLAEATPAALDELL